MYKLIRCFAPVVLVLYVAVFACPAWGEDWITAKDNPDVRYWLSSSKQEPLAESKLDIQVNATYKAESLHNIELMQPGPFKLISSKIIQDAIFGIKTGGQTYTYELQAPLKAGTYLCTFEGISQAGEKVIFSHSLNVRSIEEQNYISTGRVVGFIVGVAIVASAPTAGANPLATGFAALLGGVAFGYVGGVLGGMYAANTASNGK